MEPDFTIRNEIDSISHNRDDMENLLNRYAEGFGENSSNASNNMAVGGILSNLQSGLGFLHRDNQYIKSKLGDNTENTGFKLVIGPDTLKWIVLLLVILILIALFLKVGKKKKRNPFKKKLLALESEINTLKRQNPFNE